MKFWVGTTDANWYRFLSAKKPDEVNFWQPSSRAAFKSGPVGMPFVFKLKKPFNHIAGAGFYMARSVLPVNLAWEIFGDKNGAASLSEFRSILAAFSKSDGWNASITCQVIANPVFFDQSDWLDSPPGWSSNIVQGKMYDSTTADGAVIWDHVLPLLQRTSQIEHQSRNVTGGFANEPLAKYGAPKLTRPRLGQASFRVMVTEAYHRRCAMTGESTLLALEAAHIVPYSEDGTHEIQNGMLMRADFHRLFDAGLVSVTPDLTIRISPRIKEAWFNGKAYYRLDGQPLTVKPESPLLSPDRDRLHWHFTNRFQA